MKDIKFRGKDNRNAWHYGDLIHDKHFSYILDINFLPALSVPATSFIEVDPETVGQFTGLTDKNGKEIYEGDLVELIPKEDHKEHTNMYGIKKVIWSECDACFYYDKFISMSWSGWESEEILGNIHENPELLES